MSRRPFRKKHPIHKSLQGMYKGPPRDLQRDLHPTLHVYLLSLFSSPSHSLFSLLSSLSIFSPLFFFPLSLSLPQPVAVLAHYGFGHDNFRYMAIYRAKFAPPPLPVQKEANFRYTTIYCTKCALPPLSMRKEAAFRYTTIFRAKCTLSSCCAVVVTAVVVGALSQKQTPASHINRHEKQ
mgnify:CR=1 FL=1